MEGAGGTEYRPPAFFLTGGTTGPPQHIEGVKTMTTLENLNAPWSIIFDRDGTEDIAVLLDANGEEVARSRPFWLPQENDPIPATLAAMRLMRSAPALLAALQEIIVYAENEALSLESLKDSPEAETEAERAWKAVADAEAALKGAFDDEDCQKEPKTDGLSTRVVDYAITPCRWLAEDGKAGRFSYEPCQPEEADVWTLYGHIPGEGVEVIGDFATREHAEAIYSKMTGKRFRP